MKKFLTFLCLFVMIITNAQTEQDPVKWETSVEKISDTEYDLIFKATILKEWHLYSQYNPQEDASLPMEITAADENPGYVLIGKAKESETFKAYSDVWEKEETFFKDKATIVQRIKLTNKDLTTIKLNLFAQVCKEVCINLDDDYIFSLTGEAPIKEEINISEKDKKLSQALKLDLKNKDRLKGEKEQGETNLWTIFILGFVGGLLALLTPCVFPMIPLTVSFFTKQSQNKAKGISNAIIYGLFIVLIYVLFSVPFHFLDSIDPEILNTISTNIWLNVFFFAILVFFAFSFFGYYELTLPSSWGNKMDSASNVGGIIGIFFMALTLAIVSFSCTGPILGSLLAGSLTSDGGAMQLSAGMGGFGLALALPFALFALFPGWLNSLPKSGGWLNTTKVVLGFLELAFAFKFLSNADLVVRWGLLKREVFIGIWIITFIGLALYLFKRIKFPHDGPSKKLSLSRISFGVFVIAFVIYLAPGILKTPTWKLDTLSGFLPPDFYSIYPKENQCPLGLDCYKDFDEGLAVAQKENKPILLDFTGWACANCRKVEQKVWSDPLIYQIIQDDYVLISLYVDDRKDLPKEQQFTFLKDNGKTKKIETVGDKASTFQVVNFQVTAQPYYVQMSPSFSILNTEENYKNTTKESYLNWLKKGKVQFENEK